MAHQKTTPRDQERAFGFDELFFSTTDPKGIIQSGNDVFARVAGYSTPAELIGRPHNVIRHPDMPRAVFQLLWDYLKAGQVFAGYVKNMATDGSYYWVMALVMPIERGFLSIRFKPSSPYFSIIKELYAEMLMVESAAGRAPDSWREGMSQARETLLARLNEKGFFNYDEFMRAALSTEMMSRRANLAEGPGRTSSPSPVELLNHPSAHDAHDELTDTLATCEIIESQLDGIFSQASSILDRLKELDAKSSFLLDLADNVQLISLNGIISSTRLGEAGRGLSVVTQDLATIAGESTALIKGMTDRLSLTSPLRETAFSITAAKLQVEMAIFFLKELIGTAGASSLDAETADRRRADVETLVASFAHSTARMLENLPAAQNSVSLRVRLNNQLNGVLRKLSRVHVTGKVQAAHVTGAGHFQEYFEKIYEQLQIAKGEMSVLFNGVAFLHDHLPKFERAGLSVQSALSSFN